MRTAVRNDTGFTLGILTLILAARASKLLPPAESACKQKYFFQNCAFVMNFKMLLPSSNLQPCYKHLQDKFDFK